MKEEIWSRKASAGFWKASCGEGDLVGNDRQTLDSQQGSWASPSILQLQDEVGQQWSCKRSPSPRWDSTQANTLVSPAETPGRRPRKTVPGPQTQRKYKMISAWYVKLLNLWLLNNSRKWIHLSIENNFCIARHQLAATYKVVNSSRPQRKQRLHRIKWPGRRPKITPRFSLN